MSKTLHQYGPMKPGQSLIVDLDPAKAKELWRVLHLVYKGVKSTGFEIVNSRLQQVLKPNLFIDLDLVPVLGADVTMTFSATKEQLSYLESATGTNDQIVVLDEPKRCYIVTDGNDIETFPQKSPTGAGSFPALAAMTPMGQPVSGFDATMVKRRCTKAKAGAVNILLYGGQLEQASSNGGQPYNFKASSHGTLRDKIADEVFRSSYFLAIASKHNTSLSVARDGYGTWLITQSELSIQVKPTVYELLV